MSWSKLVSRRRSTLLSLHPSARLPWWLPYPSNGTETKSCLGRVFNSKLGRIATLLSKLIAISQPHLELKTRPRVCPVS